MIIVQGVFRIEADQRERYLAETVETQRISRDEPGCIEYVLAADPLEADRVVLSERWATRADLDAHIAALTARRAASGGDGISPASREISFFEAAATELTPPS